MFTVTQKLVNDTQTGLAYWVVAGDRFRANDRAKCAQHSVPVILDPADQAAAYLASWLEMGQPGDMIQDFARDIAGDSQQVLDALVALETAKNGLALLIEAAKDEIDRRFREATEDYGYMDAREEAYRGRRG